MEVMIRESTVKVTKALRAHVLNQIGFNLSRFGERIGRVTVRLSTVPKHPTGADRRCQIHISMRRRVRVSETDADVHTAIDRAADRATRTVARAIDREQPAAPEISP